MTVLIPRNTTITKKAEHSARPMTTRPRFKFTCCKVSANVATYNRTIGKFQLTGIPPAPRGLRRLKCLLISTRTAILHVAAKDKASGKEQKIRIEASSGFVR